MREIKFMEKKGQVRMAPDTLTILNASYCGVNEIEIKNAMGGEG